jgi:hypothetical protein
MSSKNQDALENLTTFELAFNLATGKYSEGEKLEVLRIIQDRDIKKRYSTSGSSEAEGGSSPSNEKQKKAPLKGSKAEKIYRLGLEGRTPQECYEALTKKGTTVYYPEIYRVFKRYGFL